MLTARVLNRTLLQRQRLLERSETQALPMVEHLLGLQAQDPLPPYLSLAARLLDFDPHVVSDALAERRAVRVLLMRGTIHLVTPADALALRPFVQPHLDKVTRTSAVSKPAADVPRDDLLAAGRAAFAGGPIGLKRLGEVLADRFPDHPPSALANTVREMTPLVQVPPRGMWRRSGGVVYEMLGTWLADAEPETDVPAIVRRYLRAFGPATPADFTTWCGVTGARQAFEALGDELRVLPAEDGKELFDLEGESLADAETPAPVRLLGKYDNLWLSHAGRDRVTAPERRKRWMGANGGLGNTVFVDGMLEGLWRETDGGRVDVEMFRTLTRAERQDLAAEVGRVEQLLAIP